MKSPGCLWRRSSSTPSPWNHSSGSSSIDFAGVPSAEVGP